MDFVVKKKDLTEFAVDLYGSPLAIARGDVLIRVEKFSFTSNNISYAAAGDSLQYYNFYPHHDESYGRIPVWGVGTVTVSRCDEVAEGERIYGYFPMSRYVKLTPIKVSQGDFVDGTAHRKDLPGAYNQYSRLDSAKDPFYIPDFEDLMLLLRPLFLTSWLLDDFFKHNDHFGAKRVILASASSKTAYGLAFLLQKSSPGVEVVGLTSSGNVSFVKGLKGYTTTLAYDQVKSLDPAVPTVLVDMSGSQSVFSDVHNHFMDMLKYSCVVGATHWDDKSAREPLPGPKPTFFFAPEQARLRIKEWGQEKLFTAIRDDWTAFIYHVREAGCCKVKESFGESAVKGLYKAMVGSSPNPTVGHIASMWEQPKDVSKL